MNKKSRKSNVNSFLDLFVDHFVNYFVNSIDSLVESFVNFYIDGVNEVVDALNPSSSFSGSCPIPKPKFIVFTRTKLNPIGQLI